MYLQFDLRPYFVTTKRLDTLHPGFHERTKHVEIDYYFVCERVEPQEIKHMHVDTTNQVANLFTEALGSQRLQLLLGKLDIRDLHAPTSRGEGG